MCDKATCSTHHVQPKAAGLTLAKCAGYQWLRRPSSSAKLLASPRTRDGRMLGGTRTRCRSGGASAAAPLLLCLTAAPAPLRCRLDSSCAAGDPRCAWCLASEGPTLASRASVTAASSVAAFILSSCACARERSNATSCGWFRQRNDSTVPHCE